MNSTVTAHAAQHVVTTTRRFFVRRDPPVWPFVWRGLLPLAGLVALAWFALAAGMRAVNPKQAQALYIHTVLDQGDRNGIRK